MPPDTHQTRELDHRVSDGINVWLLWRPADDRALVSVSDTKTGDSFTIEVGADQRALDVFHHPYAYAEATSRRAKRTLKPSPSGDAAIAPASTGLSGGK